MLKIIHEIFFIRLVYIFHFAIINIIYNICINFYLLLKNYFIYLNIFIKKLIFLSKNFHLKKYNKIIKFFIIFRILNKKYIYIYI